MGLAALTLECEDKDKWSVDGQEDLENLEDSQEDPGKLEREQDEEEVEAAEELLPQHQEQSRDNPH